MSNWKQTKRSAPLKYTTGGRVKETPVHTTGKAAAISTLGRHEEDRKSRHLKQDRDMVIVKVKQETVKTEVNNISIKCPWTSSGTASDYVHYCTATTVVARQLQW